MILGAWNGNQFGQSITLTFTPDGRIQFDAPNMPPQMQMSATYAWESDDRVTLFISVTGPDGQSRTMTNTANIVELTDDRLVFTDGQTGMEQTFTR